MDLAEITDLIPELLTQFYPGIHRRATSDVLPDYPGGWVLEERGAFCFIKAARATRPWIWVRVGVAVDIPRSEALAYYVATANKDLQAGRAYMRYGGQFALVAVDEYISAATITRQCSPTIQDVITRLDLSMEHARDLQHAVLERFGGRRFSGDDWALLVPDLEGTVLERRASAT